MDDHERAAMGAAINKVEHYSPCSSKLAFECIWNAARAYEPPVPHTETYTLTCCKTCGEQWPCMHAANREPRKHDDAKPPAPKCAFCKVDTHKTDDCNFERHDSTRAKCYCYACLHVTDGK